MKNNKRFNITAPINGEPEVLVCGLGSAGIAAALSAARTGAEVMAVEKLPYAGGTITGSNVTGCCGIADMISGELSVGGIALELLQKTGGLPDPLQSKKLFQPITDQEIINQGTTKKIPIRWNMEALKFTADQLLKESGVSVLYHSMIIGVDTYEGSCTTVYISNKDGISAICPRIVIDCTGDGDIAFLCGAGFEKNNILQPLTLQFTIGNIQLTDADYITKMCSTVLKKAKNQGYLENYGGPWLVFSDREKKITVNAVRLNYDASNASQLTLAEIEGRRDAWMMFDLWKREIDEFSGSYFLNSGPSVGARETRRIKGLYTLTAEDIRNCRSFPDSVAKGAWYLDRHPKGKVGYHHHEIVPAYKIPFRTLVPVGLKNIFVAGRCHSATSEALSSTRVSATSMAMGHAVGIAAVICSNMDISAAEVEISKLQRVLFEQGAIF